MKNRCESCKYFTGSGDWDLCCLNPPDRRIGCFGFLCYETTPACENYKNKDNKIVENFVEQAETGNLPPMDYLGELGLAITK